MKAYKPHHSKKHFHDGEFGGLGGRGEGSENRHHFQPREGFSDPLPLVL